MLMMRLLFKNEMMNCILEHIKYRKNRHSINDNMEMPDYKKEYLEPAVKIKQMAGSFLLRVSNSV